MRQVLSEIGITQSTTKIYQDNSGSVSWCNISEAKDFSRKRHIDIKYHHIRQHMKEGKISIGKVPEKQMKAAFLTKVLSPHQLQNAKYSIPMI